MKQTEARKRSTQLMRCGGLVMVTASSLANAPRGVRVGDAILVDGEVERVVEVIDFDLVRTA